MSVDNTKNNLSKSLLPLYEEYPEHRQQTFDNLFHLRKMALTNDLPNQRDWEALPLNPKEWKTLDGIFNHRHLSPQFTLQDVLGLDTFCLLNSLEPVMEKKKLTDITNHFLKWHWFSYLCYEREKAADPENPFTKKYVFTRKTICQRLKEVPSLLKLAQPKASPAHSTDPTTSRRQKLKQRLQKRHAPPREMDMAVVKQVEDRIEIFTKLYQHPQGPDVLLYENLEDFPGASALSHPSAEFLERNVTDLTLYAKFLNQMMQIAYERSPIQREGHGFHQVEQALAAMQPATLSSLDAKVIDLQQRMHENQQSTEALLSHALRDFRLAKEGTLTYDKWRQDPAPPQSPMPQLQFEEWMHFSYNIQEYYDYFSSHLQIGLDQEILEPSYPHFVNTQHYFRRLVLNIHHASLPIQSLQTVEHIPLQPLNQTQKEFIHCLDQVLQPIEALFAPLNEACAGIDDQQLRALMQGSRSLASFRIYIRQKFGQCLPLLDVVKEHIVQTTEKLNGYLKDSALVTVQGLPADEKKAHIEELQNTLLKRCIPLIRHIMILEDLNTIFTGKYALNPKYLPDELVDLLSLDAFDEWLVEEPLPLPSMEQPPAPLPPPIEQVSPPEDKEEEEKGTSALPSLPPPRKKVASPLTSERKPKARAMDVNEIRRERKRKKIEELLRKFGFDNTRTKGSHATWQSQNGSVSVTVPKHKEISIGVRNNIADAVADSLHNHSIPHPESKT